MRKRFWIFILFTVCLSLEGLSQSPSIRALINNADVVVHANIKNYFGPFNGDLGTDFFMVDLEVKKVYKSNFHFSMNPAQITWIVSNLRCSEVPMSKCITKYEKNDFIFFLRKEHFYGGAELPDSLIKNFSILLDQTIDVVVENQLLKFDYFEKDSSQTCSSNCKVCKHIKGQNWSKFEKELKKDLRRNNRLNLMDHRRIKWVLNDRVILSSLPSYTSSRLCLITGDGKKEAVINYQVGYCKARFTWIPHLLSSWFNWDSYSAFSRENVDTLIYRSMSIDSLTRILYMKFEKQEYNRQLKDSIWSKKYGSYFELPDWFVLNASVFDGPLNLYTDFKYHPAYISKAKTLIDSLVSRKKFYNLGLMVSHQIPEISEYAIQQIQSNKVMKCVPFLIEYAEYKLEAFTNGAESYEEQSEVFKAITLCLDELTNCKTIVHSVPFGIPTKVFDLSLSLPIWKSKLAMN